MFPKNISRKNCLGNNFPKKFPLKSFRKKASRKKNYEKGHENIQFEKCFLC